MTFFSKEENHIKLWEMEFWTKSGYNEITKLHGDGDLRFGRGHHTQCPSRDRSECGLLHSPSTPWFHVLVQSPCRKRPTLSVTTGHLSPHADS